jgi:hypothetical protein
MVSVKIQAKTFEGTKGLAVMYGEQWKGTAKLMSKKKLINEDPYTIEIHFSKLGRFSKFVHSNTHVKNMILSQMHDSLSEYNLTENDYKLEVK